MNGVVIALFSPIGGSGATTLSIHLAGHLSESDSVCVLDLHSDEGLVAQYLNLASAGENSQAGQLAQSTDIKFTNVPEEVRYNEKLTVITPSRATMTAALQSVELISQLRRRFAFTVVDLPGTVATEDLLAILGAVDKILLLGVFNLQQMARQNRFLNWFKDQKSLVRNATFVVNKYESWRPLLKRQCQAYLELAGFGKYAVIECDMRTSKWCANQGQLAPQHTSLYKGVKRLVMELDLRGLAQ